MDLEGLSSSFPFHRRRVPFDPFFLLVNPSSSSLLSAALEGAVLIDFFAFLAAPALRFFEEGVFALTIGREDPN